MHILGTCEAPERGPNGIGCVDFAVTSPLASRIVRLTLNVSDLDRSVSFYVGGLGFGVDARTADRASLTIGSQRIELVSRLNAAPYPLKRAANDPWFQHFAIAVADMDAAYIRLSGFSPEPISQGGPQLLPPSTGSVTAYKFRDPDGHPLELSYAPGSSWTSLPRTDAVFLGIDHTALAVQSLDASITFYTRLGLTVGARSLNQGPEQARLDGLADPVVDIVTLLTPDAGPHIELLHYRSPTPARADAVAPGEIAATEIVFAARSDLISERRDPDGHLLRFITS